MESFDRTVGALQQGVFAQEPGAGVTVATLLISTKLHIPSPRPEYVPRPRLVERLDRAPCHKLTLISAPAGFGKTALLSEWIATREPDKAVAWVSLDEMDNDPARFFAYVTTALRTAGLEIDDIAQTDQDQPEESALIAVINQVAATDTGIALVLDDYHVIRSDDIHRALGFLIEHIPPQLHLVISTRADPPLPLARLRGRGELNELRSADLRFGVAEASEFFCRVMGLDLTPDDVAALEERTEGWIAGLQLAALSMRETQDVARFVHSFAGSHRYILDYLVEEVLAHQSRQAQDFLMATCVLDRLTGSLCEAVCGPDGEIIAESEAQAMLDDLDRANLFVFPMDNERIWYRYHHLFAEVLQARLSQSRPEDVKKYHLRAAEWYHNNGFGAQAVAHALAGEDYHRAGHLIEDIAEPMLMRSEVTTLTEWLEALPNDILLEHPSLCVFHGWALLLGGQPLETIEARVREVAASDEDKPATLTALRASLAVFQGRAPHAIALCQDALAQAPKDEAFLRDVLAWSLGIAYAVAGQVDAADKEFDRARRVAEANGNTIVAVAAQTHQAEVKIVQGRLREAHALYEHALALATDSRGRHLPIASLALIGLGDLSRERNELDTACGLLQEGLVLTRKWGMIGALDGYINLARAKLALGDAESAQELIDRANRLAIRFDASELDDALVTVQQVDIWLARGNTAEAVQWMQDRGLAVSDIPTGNSARAESDHSALNQILEAELVAQVRVLLALGHDAEAIEIIDRLLAHARASQRRGNVIGLLVLRAMAFAALGDTRSGLAAIEKALALAAPEGYVRVFLDRGPNMARLLYKAASSGIHVEYAGRLLAAFPDTEPQPPLRTTQGELIETLSKRELQVLESIAEGCSNREIAQKLYISLRTVKWHSSNIYGKLGVSNRTQAVAKARGIGILQP